MKDLYIFESQAFALSLTFILGNNHATKTVLNFTTYKLVTLIFDVVPYLMVLIRFASLSHQNVQMCSVDTSLVLVKYGKLVPQHGEIWPIIRCCLHQCLSARAVVNV